MTPDIQLAVMFLILIVLSSMFVVMLFGREGFWTLLLFIVLYAWNANGWGWAWPF
jgi:hypothetical protein